jgi:hypothetical protein
MLGAFLIAFIQVFLATGFSAPGEESQDSVLNLRIDYLNLENADLEKALWTLRYKAPGRIIIGFEKMPQRENEKTATISMDWTQATVAEILAKILLMDKRYTYELVEGKLIHVFPQGAKNDVTDLLNIRIKNFKVKGRESIDNVISHIADWAPELGRFLQKRASEYRKRKGIPEGGPGVLMRGDMTPEVHIEFAQKTVREILHSLVLYSAELYPKKLGLDQK